MMPDIALMFHESGSSRSWGVDRLKGRGSAKKATINWRPQGKGYELKRNGHDHGMI
jgi:hypothetical protein